VLLSELPAVSPAGGEASRESLPAHGWLLIAAIVLGVFSGHWGLMGVPVPLDRLALAGSFACFGWWWLRGGEARLRPAPVHVAMVATVLLCLVSAFLFGTMTQPDSLFALLDRVVMPYVAFVFAPLALATPLSRRRLVQALTWTGLYVGLTATLSVWGPESLLFPRYLADPSVGIAHGRARGPSAEAVGTGLLVVTCGVAAAINAQHSRGFQKVGSAVTVVVCTIAGFLSLTRSIWLAMLLVLLSCALVLPAARGRVLACGAAVAALVAVVLLLVPGVGNAALDRLGTERSLEDRAYTNEAAVRMAVENPLTGVGWGRFRAASSDYIFQHDTAPLTNVGIEVHNVFLSRAAELGVPGLALTAAVVLLGPVRGLGRPPPTRDGSATRVLALAAVVSWLSTSLVTGLSFAFANLLAWAVAGLAFHQVSHPEPVVDAAAPGDEAPR
jgi:putative inorganic carbon (HCO3(-)) transporter